MLISSYLWGYIQFIRMVMESRKNRNTGYQSKEK